MLTREHGIATCEAGLLAPDRLTRLRHAGYVRYAERMLTAYRRGLGRTRCELHQSVRAILATDKDCPQQRVGAFAKLLDDVSQFDEDRRGEAAAMRRTVFRRAAAFHPLFARPEAPSVQDEAGVKRRIAAELGTRWVEIDRRLFADVIECQRLRAFDGYADAAALLARYNVAQVQVALYDALEMTVWASDDFKTILRYAKLARLLHTIRGVREGHYVIRLDGPASVLRKTRRYGVAMAKFLPALIACRGWRMHALVAGRGGRWRRRLELSAEDGLSSHLPPASEFDSCLEADFADRWGADAREGWTIEREAELLHDRQHTFVPDFLLRHADGRRVLLEIAGFWTPEYLEAKLRTLSHFREQPILLAVDAATDPSFAWPAKVVRFKRKLRPEEVLAALGTLDRS